jgi:hypothetical protein
MLQKIFLHLVICIVPFYAVAQPSNIIVADSNKATTLIIENTHIIDVAGNQVLYTVKGNLIFSGNSENKEDIIFMLNAADIFSKKTAQLIAAKDNKPILTVSKGKVYLGTNTFAGRCRKNRFVFYFQKRRKSKGRF